MQVHALLLVLLECFTPLAGVVESQPRGAPPTGPSTLPLSRERREKKNKQRRELISFICVLRIVDRSVHSPQTNAPCTTLPDPVCV